MPSIARALALFIGTFTLINLAASLHGFHGNAWWIDIAPLPPTVGALLLLVASLALVIWSLWPDCHRLLLGTTLALTSALLIVALWNVIRFYALWARGSIHPGLWIPLSLLVALSLGTVIAALRLKPTPLRPALFSLALAAAALGFPLSQMACFGRTDYRRSADVIVVFGARAYADGRCSQALADRVRSAVALYHAGLAPTLLMSGAQGDGAVHETEAMRRLAVALGVPDDAILCDLAGVNTQATVTNTLRQLAGKRVLVVSHWYHLPRVKMCYQAAGLEVFTVPAKESSVLTQYPWLLTREVAALWMYYLKAL